MLNYMIIFKKCFRTAQLIRFKIYSFVTLFPNTEVPGWGVTKVFIKVIKILSSKSQSLGFKVFGGLVSFTIQVELHEVI